MTYEEEFEVTGSLEDAVEEAVEYREEARTFNTSVGAAVETYDGEVYGGFNMENKRHRGLHAEENAINNALLDGYNATDFKSLIVVYKEEDEDDTEIFPACLSCQAWAWDYTHPKMDVVVTDAQGEPLYRAKLDDITDHPGPGKTYPSNRISGRDELQNAEPRLPLADELHEFYEDDKAFREFCDQVNVDLPDDLEA